MLPILKEAADAIGQVFEGFRLIKRRTVANEACDAGRVSANGRPVKASYDVKTGDAGDPVRSEDPEGGGAGGGGQRPQGRRPRHVSGDRLALPALRSSNRPRVRLGTQGLVFAPHLREYAAGGRRQQVAELSGGVVVEAQNAFVRPLKGIAGPGGRSPPGWCRDRWCPLRHTHQLPSVSSYPSSPCTATVSLPSSAKR